MLTGKLKLNPALGTTKVMMAPDPDMVNVPVYPVGAGYAAVADI